MPAILLKDIPEDVRIFIIKTQGEVKNERRISQYSMQLAIYKIIREHHLFGKKSKDG